MIKIVSLNVGRPQSVPFEKKEVSTGIYKHPVAGEVFLSSLNFDGDGQADLVHHGGKDKAVCVYPYEHYAYWTERLGRELQYGAFGENLTTQGLLEDDVCIGDTFQAGGAVLQVSQPRQPCFKLSVKYGVPELPLWVQNTGYTGYYFRVLQEGNVAAGDELILLERHLNGRTVTFANRMMHHEKQNLEGMRAMLAVDRLSDSWRKTFDKRLGGIETDTKERLTGQA
ncbi:MOSC domain-containing protein [Paenibacillus sp. MZ04-78.2]|uniref:MOSC domain-containing protein n=1 Tax=Paenibacillus sp. MZ04-78.2 TaxID=2962034 RepID=UPI0020B63CEE|nr:MOSC domain-containing protein [Paenibacillus sp. MZ04-78.2]MCP3772374.1 MOSC domain-containing protein [Paenibacillus sp. MZ04-78.2]